MKKSMWILAFSLLISVLGGAQTASPANSSPDAETQRMFFPRDMFWGWGQFDLAPPHNEIDPNLCAGNAVQSVCALYAFRNAGGASLWPGAIAALYDFWRAHLSFRQEPSEDALYLVARCDWHRALMGRGNLHREGI